MERLPLDDESWHRERQCGRYHRPSGRSAVCDPGGCLLQRKHRILAVLLSSLFVNLCDSLAVRPLLSPPRLGPQLQLKIGIRMCEAGRGEGYKMKRVVVVGGGVGGLCVAGRLAKERPEWDITVLEKNPEAGGRLQTVHDIAPGFRFDTGPTLLLAPGIYRQTFQALGSRLEDHVTLVRVDPAYRVVSPDGSNLTASADMHEMKEQLEEIEPGAFQGFLRYISEAGINYVKGFNSRPFSSKDNSLWDYANLDNLALLREFKPINLVQSHSERLKTFFKTQKLRDIMSFQDLYVGLAPHTAPAIFSLLQYLEIVEGVWYPIGGFSKVRDGLVKCVEGLGVEIRYGAEVGRVVHDDDERVIKGVEVLEAGGKTIRIDADIVVTNLDLPGAYNTIIEAPSTRGYAERLKNMDYSSGTIAFYFALKKQQHALEHHTVFLTGGGEEAWDVALRGAAELPDDPSFYVACPGKTDATACPPGCESMMVLVPVGCIPPDGHADYTRVKELAREKVLARLKRAGVEISEEDIVGEFVLTPREWRDKYGLYRGASFGLSHRMTQLVALRPANRDPRIKNLFFVGASTSPGNGVPLVMAGAKMCVERILGEVG